MGANAKPGDPGGWIDPESGRSTNAAIEAWEEREKEREKERTHPEAYPQSGTGPGRHWRGATEEEGFYESEQQQYGPEGSAGWQEHLEALAKAVIDDSDAHAYDRLHDLRYRSPGAQAMFDVVQPHWEKRNRPPGKTKEIRHHIDSSTWPEGSELSPTQRAPRWARDPLLETRKKTTKQGAHNVKITKNKLKALIKEELNIFNEQEDEMTFPPDEVVVEPGERGHPGNTALTNWLRENIEMASGVEDVIDDVAAMVRGEGDPDAPRDVTLTSEITIDSLQELISILRQG